GKIVGCGNHEDQIPEDSSRFEVRDLNQRWIFPGFYDSHIHASVHGKMLIDKWNLRLPRTVKELKSRLKVMIENDLTTGWIEGFGWDHELMDRIPTKEDLDEVIPDRPVFLNRICLHIIVANSKALKVANITNDIKDPDNGHLDRYPEGHPLANQLTGVLREDGGVQLITKIIPQRASDLKKKDILAGLHDCLKNGITSLHSIEQSHWQEYVELAKENLLPISCYISPWFTDMDTDNFPKFSGESYPNLHCDCVKVFLDGALGVSTAAISQPYVSLVNGKENYGVVLQDRAKLEKILRKINDRGFRPEMHVIGDRAVEIALDCLEKVGVDPKKRPIFVHCQILRRDLIDRMRKCGVVPTIQPTFVTTDSGWIRQKLPPSLFDCIYPWKTLLQNGIVCGGSSDGPVENINPLHGIYDAIFRTDQTTGEPFIPSECLTFKEAVNLYTTYSAYVDNAENFKGKIESGFQADFVVLDVPLADDGLPMHLPKHPEILKEVQISEVWVAGKCLLK
uniref:Amidohydrolase 3 domain-containing protein n=1 Tax=Ciona savignyi TaxID=51511 RepID=H2YL38_CIOSA